MSGEINGMKPEELLADALDLSATDRWYLAIRLLDSVPMADRKEGVETAVYFQELDRRVADLTKVHRAEDSWQDG